MNQINDWKDEYWTEKNGKMHCFDDNILYAPVAAYTVHDKRSF